MGESMEPTLPEGGVILLDRNRCRRREGRIFVVRTEEGLVVKRADKGTGGGWQLVSDHPRWPDAPWPDDAAIIGEVEVDGEGVMRRLPLRRVATKSDGACLPPHGRMEKSHAEQTRRLGSHW